MKRGRPFEPGNKLSRGRPCGSRNKRTWRSQQLLDEHGEAIVHKALVAALKGDVPLLRTFLGYILRRPEDRPVETGPLHIGSAEELSKALDNVMMKVASGKLSPGDAQAVAALIESRRRVLETQDLEMRLRALEQLPQSEGSD
jgi:hypothetical protein